MFIRRKTHKATQAESKNPFSVIVLIRKWALPKYYFNFGYFADGREFSENDC